VSSELDVLASLRVLSAGDDYRLLVDWERGILDRLSIEVGLDLLDFPSCGEEVILVLLLKLRSLILLLRTK
jgi:hypothetical protein